MSFDKCTESCGANLVMLLVKIPGKVISLYENKTKDKLTRFTLAC